MTHRFTISDWPRPVRVFPRETILDAFLREGVPISHGCRSGTCGACKARLVRGDVELASHSIYALTERDRADGLVLTCRAYARSEGEIIRLSAGDVAAHPLRRLECEVSELADLTHEIRRIRMRVVKGGPFAFSAGQFASITFTGQPPRDYSMANRPSDPLLEFHVRRISGGTSSVHAATKLSVGDRVQVDGPYGACWLRPSHAGPIVAVAGGSGLAPMKSIVETALASGMRQPIRLYMTAPSDREFYLEDHFRGLEKRFDNFAFTPTLEKSSGVAGQPPIRVHDMVLADLGILHNVNIHLQQQPDTIEPKAAKVYAAGPSSMVESLTQAMITRGVQRADIHAEPFHVAPTEPSPRERMD
jgi:naphthalene 1,2-dioxygenase ferredoxin reductase component